MKKRKKSLCLKDRAGRKGEDILVGIDDDEELDTVVEAYEELAGSRTIN